MRVITFFAPSAMAPDSRRRLQMKARKALFTDAAIYIGKLMIGLALSTLAWLAFPVAQGGACPAAIETAQHNVRIAGNPTTARDERK
jgi:hypothetical protein